MSAQVHCPNCGWVDLRDTETMNIEEGMQGEDIVTCRCRECGEEFRSTVHLGHSSEDEEYYRDDMDGDFDSAMASAGYGTDEDYGYYGEE